MLTDQQPVDVTETASELVFIYNLPETEDAKDWEALYSFVRGTQHDHAPAAWDGTRRQEGSRYYRERYLARGFVPIDAGSPKTRKPDLQTPIAREIVELFTAVLLGGDISIHVPVDAATETFFSKVWTHGKYSASFAAARNMAGAAQYSVVVPRLIGGRPTLDVIRGSQVKVLRWSESEACQPEVAVWQRLVCKEVKDDQGNIATKEFWRTCMWTPTEFVDFEDVPKSWDAKKPLPERSRKPHGCKRCPVTWYRNTAIETDCPRGVHDFDQLEGRCDAIDQLGSQLRGVVGNNCEPTVWQSDVEHVRRKNLINKRGRGVVVQLSEQGKLGLMESSAESIRASIEYFERLISDTMILAGCVKIKPDVLTSIKSGRAIKLLYKPTEAKAKLLQFELIDAIVRVLECNYEMAQHFGVSSIEDPKPGTIILPSRVISEAPPHDTTEEQAEGAAEAPRTLAMEHGKRFEVCAPGHFGTIEIGLPEYHAPSPEEKSAELQGLMTVSGGNAILSRKTAVEKAAQAVGVDPVEECRRLAEEEEERMAQVEAFKEPAGAGEEDGEEAEEDEGAETDEEDDEEKGEAEEDEPEDEGEEDEAE